MIKQTLLAASIALLLAGPAVAGDPGKRDSDGIASTVERAKAKKPPARLQAATKRSDVRERAPVRDWRDNQPRPIATRDDRRDRDRNDRSLPERVWRSVDHQDGDRRRDDHDWRDHDGDHDWRDHDSHDHDWRGHDWRDRDYRRDDDWRRRGWAYQGWRNDGWRYYRFNDNRHWRYMPPYRYSLDYGYRSGYELAWRDWLNYGRYNHGWRRGSFGFGLGGLYRSGYDAGWRDAAYYYDRGYRPDYWGYDPQGGWYFSFSLSG